MMRSKNPQNNIFIFKFANGKPGKRFKTDFYSSTEHNILLLTFGTVCVTEEKQLSHDLFFFDWAILTKLIFLLRCDRTTSICGFIHVPVRNTVAEGVFVRGRREW